MAYRVRWSPQALADINAIAEYIERNSPFYAKAVVTKIVAVTRQFAEFPFFGCAVPEAGDNRLWEHLVFSYRIISLVEENQVTVTAVVHGKWLVGAEEAD